MFEEITQISSFETGAKVKNNYNNKFQKNANGRNERVKETQFGNLSANSIDHLIISEPYNALNGSDIYSNNVYDAQRNLQLPNADQKVQQEEKQEITRRRQSRKASEEQLRD